MLKNQLNLYQLPFPELFESLLRLGKCSYDYHKHMVLVGDDEANILGYLRLPLHVSLSDRLEVKKEEAVAIYLTIESGNAAICVMKGIENVYHKTFSAYMTRKKQGVSQIKYLNKKGKSRAGSRVRLAETVEFFESINLKLQDLFIEDQKVERIALDCSPTLIPYLYGSKVATPFEKKDERLYKIPLHLPQCNYTNLFGAIKKLRAPILYYEDSIATRVQIVFNKPT
jgi:hypothetical protein